MLTTLYIDFVWHNRHIDQLSDTLHIQIPSSNRINFSLAEHSVVICRGIWKVFLQLQPTSPTCLHLYFQYWVFPWSVRLRLRTVKSLLLRSKTRAFRWISYYVQTTWVYCHPLFLTTISRVEIPITELLAKTYIPISGTIRTKSV